MNRERLTLPEALNRAEYARKVSIDSGYNMRYAVCLIDGYHMAMPLHVAKDGRYSITAVTL